MSIRTVLSAVILGATCMSHADDVSKEAAINELLEVSGTRDSIDAVLHDTLIQIRARADQAGLLANDPESKQAYLTEFEEVVREYMGWERIRPIAVAMYDSAFDEAEITAMIEFMKTEAGQKMVENLPEFVAAMQKAQQELTTEMVPELRAIRAKYGIE